MSIPKLRIEFDNPRGSYYSGATVTGSVILELAQQRKCRGLQIKFVGKARVKWSGWKRVESEDNKVNQERVDYHSDEEYFKYKYYLAGNVNGNLSLSKGKYTYPFTTTLPEKLPTSFEGEYGHVRYTVTAILETSGKMDIEVKENFRVIDPLDLNYNTRAKKPVKKEEEKHFCCCCCKSGPLTLVACLPQTGYVPGQDIPVTIEVDNASNVKVLNIEMKIMKNLKWFARHPDSQTKAESKELSKVVIEEGIECKGSSTVTQSIKVPKMSFINLNCCSIINVSFLLRVTACVEGKLKQNLSTEIPLIIGTVPIDNTMKNVSLTNPKASMGMINVGDRNLSLQQPFGGDINQIGICTIPGADFPNTINVGDRNLSSQQSFGGGINQTSMIPGADFPSKITGFNPPESHYGLRTASLNQTGICTFPGAVFPNTIAGFNPPEMQYGFRTADMVIPSAPAFDADTSLLIPPDK